jgi:ornithine cyclodeaminase
MKILSVESVTKLLKRHRFDAYMRDLMNALKRDFSRWDQFNKVPRPAMHVPGGVLELMPICDNNKYFSFKYVSGAYPANPTHGKLAITATGQLSNIIDGYPIFISEMTILTALRTAATAALATDLMSRKDAHVLALIGTGAQSEFQVYATQLVRDITEVRYFDTDPKAMDKFEHNVRDKSFTLTRCNNAEEAVKGADVITVCTACKAHVAVIKNAWVKKGMHINGLGGDCPGKTELEKSILPRSKVVVEYFDQSIHEGEIQRFTREDAEKLVYAELHELVLGKKKGRMSDKEITVFDSVGIALEDYSVLRLTYELAEKYKIGEEIEMIPDIANPKDLFSVINEQRLTV